ncbi:hypothetical protein Rmet_0461 [Cupriavidus metallidurans CH34]|uniref:Uncharacterized protein n=1 Tax=Cupriavidus metallidurans (strain ATCC 43123 / DSM 2839 / NBRC 102507 / CH34) TaxID=266264 RepID=Q1LR79_CUPMC|nr:hypothetical protein Rmet_0461 [Cupriavidus metallidurans CH34]
MFRIVALGNLRARAMPRGSPLTSGSQAKQVATRITSKAAAHPPQATAELPWRRYQNEAKRFWLDARPQTVQVARQGCATTPESC